MHSNLCSIRRCCSNLQPQPIATDRVEIKGAHDVVLSFPPNHRLRAGYHVVSSNNPTQQWENYPANRARDMAFEAT
jgi:hypothetical protein